MVPDAMYQNGTAFYPQVLQRRAHLFPELLKRYPKTEWKKDANEQLKKLLRDAKNKTACQS